MSPGKPAPAQNARRNIEGIDDVIVHQGTDAEAVNAQPQPLEYRVPGEIEHAEFQSCIPFIQVFPENPQRQAQGTPHLNRRSGINILIPGEHRGRAGKGGEFQPRQRGPEPSPQGYRPFSIVDPRALRPQMHRRRTRVGRTPGQLGLIGVLLHDIVNGGLIFADRLIRILSQSVIDDFRQRQGYLPPAGGRGYGQQRKRLTYYFHISSFPESLNLYDEFIPKHHSPGRVGAVFFVFLHSHCENDEMSSILFGVFWVFRIFHILLTAGADG